LTQIVVLERHPRDVASRVRQALHEAHPDRVVRAHDDGDRRRRMLRGANGGRRGRRDDVHLQGDQLVGQRGQTIELPLGPAIVNDHGLAVDPAALAELVPERREPLGLHL
jgi:hypothetical protein